MFWNCRGISNSPTKCALRRLVSALAEPKTSFVSLKAISLEKFGFDSLFSTPTLDSGISHMWCFAKSSTVSNYSILNFSPQHISIKVVNSVNDETSLVTAVYGSTDYRVRRDLWNSLISSSSTTLPWCVLGDFNAIPDASEKLSSRPARASLISEFQSMLITSGLTNAGYEGPHYTWSNKRKGQAYAAARLDRVLLNYHWRQSVGDYLVKHHPRYSSDHNPLLFTHTTRNFPKNIPSNLRICGSPTPLFWS